MGFMTAAGAFSESFGKAFSNSYGQTQQIKAQRERDEKEQENDIFKMTLKEQMDNKVRLDEQKKKESGITATAEALSATYGGPASKYAQMLMDGADKSAVEDYASKADWTQTTSKELTLAAPPTSGNNANNTGRNVGRLPPIDSDAGVEAAQGATEQQMQDVFPGSTTTRTDPATFEAMPSSTPSAAPVASPPTIKGTEVNGYIRTPKQDKAAQVSLTNDLEVAIKSGNQGEIDRATANIKSYNESTKRDTPETIDLTKNLQIAIASGDDAQVAQATENLQKFNAITKVNEPKKVDLNDNLQAAIASGDKTKVASASDALKQYNDLTNKDKPEKTNLESNLQEAIASGDSNQIAQATQAFRAFSDIKSPAKPEKIDLDTGLQEAIASGDKTRIAEAKAKVDAYAGIQNANRPAPIGRTAIDLQNELTLARTPQERSRIQAAIDASVNSEFGAKALAEGPKQGIFIDENGVHKPGIVTPERGPNGLVYRAPDGSTGARPLVPGEDKALQELFSAGDSGEGKEQREKVADMAAAYRSAGRINDILESNPDILAGGVGTVTKFVSDMAGEVRAAGNLLNVEVQQNPDGSISPDSITAIEDRLKGININEIEDDASKRAIFNAEMATMVYRAGAAMGQSGAAFGAKDQELIKRIVGADASKGQTAQSIMGNYLDSARRRVDDGSNLLNKNAVEKFKGQYQYTPTDKVIPTVEDLVNDNPNDETLKKGLSIRTAVTPAAPPAQAPVAQSGLTRTFKGSTYRLKGGNPNDKNNWEKVE